jgi:hypothetical protein
LHGVDAPHCPNVRTRRADTLLKDPAAVVPKRHAEVVKVPHNGPQGTKVLSTQDHVDQSNGMA